MNFPVLTNSDGTAASTTREKSMLAEAKASLPPVRQPTIADRAGQLRSRQLGVRARRAHAPAIAARAAVHPLAIRRARALLRALTRWGGGSHPVSDVASESLQPIREPTMPRHRRARGDALDAAQRGRAN